MWCYDVVIVICQSQVFLFVSVRLHDSIQDEGFHYLVFDL